MREAFVNISEVPTHIMTWGHWIEESFPKKEVVICITGNPGLPGFYSKFMSSIHDTVGTEIPVWVIGMLIIAVMFNLLVYQQCFNFLQRSCWSR